MKKLGLKPDELKVETFEVGTTVAGRGTVLGHDDTSVHTCGFTCVCQDTVYTNNDPTCHFSCECATGSACTPTGGGR